MEENILEVIQVEAENNLGFNQPLAQVSLSVDSMSVTEDSGENLIYNFTRDGDTTNSLLVNFTVSGSATLDTDYNQTGAEEFDTAQGKVTIAAGQTTATVTITPIADNEIESDETVELTLTQGNYIIDADTSGMAKSAIANDDVKLNVDWAKQFGGRGNGYRYLDVDGDGNTYVTGRFGDTVTFGDDTLTSEDNGNIFVTKFDKDGNPEWAKNFGGTSGSIKDIVVDDAGNTYLSGDFRDTGTFGDTILEGGESGSIFVSKLDDQGEHIWAKKFSNNNTSIFGGNNASGIDIDDKGNTYITGYFRDTITFSNTTLEGGQSNDIFVAKLDNKGDVVWATDFGSDDGFDVSSDIAIDAEGNSYIAGRFDNTITFGSTTLEGGESGNPFAAKFDNNGDLLWATDFDGGSDGYDKAYGIALDSEGNAYIIGEYVEANWKGDIFAAKLDSKGDVLWEKEFDANDSSIGAEAITIDDTDNIYIAASHSGESISIDKFMLYDESGGNAFITKLDTKGEVNWAQNIGGINGESIIDIAVNDEKIHLAGYFFKEVTFGNETFTTQSSDGDKFLVKLEESKPESEIEKPEVSLSVDSNKITEGNNNQITYTFTRTGELNTALTIDFTAAGTATFNEDYRLTGAEEFDGSEGKVTFEAEEATATVSLNITDDNIVEQDETVALSLAMGSNYTVSMTDVAANTITISSDDKEVIVDEKPEIPIDNNNDNQDDEKEEIEIPIGNENNDDDDNDDETEFTLASQTKQTFKLKSNSTTGKSPIKFSFKSKSIDELKEIAVVTVDDDEGNIDGISPNSEGYIEAALERSQSIFSLLGNTPQGFGNIDIEKVLEFSSETRFRFLSVKGGTLQGVKQGKINKSQVTVSSTDLLQISESEKNSFDLDFEGVKIKMKFDAKAKKAVGSGLQDEIEVLDFRDLTGTRTVEFSVNREAAFDNVIGFYKVTSKNGGIDTDGDGTADVLVGNENYAQIAVQNRIASIDLNVENQFPKTLTRTLEAGAIIVPFLIVNGNTEAFDDIFFPYIGANSDGVDHVMMLGDNTFGFEDLKGGGDRDYNDFLVKVDVMNMNVDAMSVST